MSGIQLAIINGYSADARSSFREAGISQAEDLFAALFGRILPEAKLDVFFPGDQAFRTPDLGSYAGFVWTGSNGTIYKDAPENQRQLELMATLLKHDRPIWGSCWGLQVAAQAAGGQVGPCRKGREWLAARRVRLNETGRKHPMFTGKPAQFDGFVMHLDEVLRPPPGATVLASNDHCEIQAFELRRGKAIFWGTQYHPEFNAGDMGRLIRLRTEPILREGHVGPERLNEIIANLERMESLQQEPESQAGTQERMELLNITRDLDLDPSILGQELLEREILNWTRHVLKPSLSEVGRA